VIERLPSTGRVALLGLGQLLAMRLAGHILASGALKRDALAEG
jgi:hypothetical protein